MRRNIITIKQTKWVKGGKVTNVWIKSNGVEEWVEISGYNPFPFFGSTKFKTTKKVFEGWMIENGFNKIVNFSEYFSVRTIETLE